MKSSIILTFLLVGSLSQAADETKGICEVEAAKVVLATASKYEKTESAKAGRSPSKLKIVRIKNTVIDAGDAYYDKYLLQPYRFSVQDGQWLPATGRAAQIVFSYDLVGVEKGGPDCALSFFSYVGYSIDDYDSLGE